MPDAFDRAGMAYPSESWTLEDYFFAAEQLTEYDATGAVSVPGTVRGIWGRRCELAIPVPPWAMVSMTARVFLNKPRWKTPQLLNC